jgi:hypothetical protein
MTGIERGKHTVKISHETLMRDIEVAVTFQIQRSIILTVNEQGKCVQADQ